MPNMATWNMQGASHATEQKWTTGVKNMIKQEKLEVVCLQECGEKPKSAVPIYNPLGNADYFLYQWGTDRAHLFITHYHWDLNGNRCNLAIISKERPAYWELLNPVNGPNWRPAIGAYIEDRWYYSIHAISPHGPDAAGLLTQIYLTANGAPWVAMGDFNRDHRTLIPPLNCALCPSNLPTYSMAAPLNYYDYMCTNMQQQPLYGKVLDGLFMSDHRAVRYAMP